jgi:hypothetical protein
VDQLLELRDRVAGLASLTADAGTQDVVTVPLTRDQSARFIKGESSRDELWAHILGTDGTVLAAVDEVSALGERDPEASAIYPELHMRLISWWLVHAWRAVDLLEDSLSNLRSWRITTAAVTCRALLEEVGCLVDEARSIADAWGKVKLQDPGSPAAVRTPLLRILNKVTLSTRITGAPEVAKATNVLTYVQHLARFASDDRILNWYDWLSDAAHPAFGARIALASPPMRHSSGALIVRSYGRSPMFLVDSSGNREQLDHDIAEMCCDTLITSGRIATEVLDQALAVVDDFGLTTRASSLTRRWYWRDFLPANGNRPCPCGRGAWARCGHFWGRPGPKLEIAETARLP